MSKMQKRFRANIEWARNQSLYALTKTPAGAAESSPAGTAGLAEENIQSR
jgi:hypothetical protein